MYTILRKAVDILASYGFACLIFLFLLLLTYLGTLEQVEHGLYETQQRYFASLFLVHEFFGVVPVVLPGVRLLLTLLFINIVCGGIVRMRKGWRQLGVMIVHVGIIVLLVGGYITYRFSMDGHLTLYENQQSSEFQSYHTWEIALAQPNEDGSRSEYIVSDTMFAHLGPDGSTTFQAEGLPFEITIRGYTENARPVRAAGNRAASNPVVDGFYLEPLPLEKENERNAAGAYVTLTEKNGGVKHDGILWGLATAPLAMAIDGQPWQIDLRRQRWELPFAIHLDRFTRELHPRTSMAKAFMSDVTKIEGGTEQKIKISMNEPLRHKGYTLYQASWGPADAGPNDRLFSTFAVVRNPADKFPLYACVIITFGLLFHFSQKLFRFLRAEQKKVAA
ncbi:MAG: cytochrome c biogenesis protein ResB [Candidatus Hydrogenedentes bacterium]|nr:cytochrome c biogenesis protein ResB [Candidatus Hydrogenedentota bacterium]